MNVPKVVIARLVKKAIVAHLRIVSINISSGVTQKYSKNIANAKKAKKIASFPNNPQNPNRERKPIQPYFLMSIQFLSKSCNSHLKTSSAKIVFSTCALPYSLSPPTSFGL